MLRLASAIFLVSITSLAAPAQDSVEAEIERLAESLATRSKARAESARLGAEARAALNDRDLPKAKELLFERIEVDPQNFVPWYNLACVFSIENQLDESARMLGRAVELGFISKETLERDSWLANVRKTQFYSDLIANWPKVLEARRDAQVATVRRWLDGPVERSVAEDLRLDILSHYDPKSTAMAIDNLRDVAAWAESISPELFGVKPDDPWTVVLLPERRDFTKWAVATYGPDAIRPNAGIAGAYAHDHRRLVANDLGPTLRHEFLHVLHWRGMDRLDQMHPIWVQEGLASLVEDLDPVGDGLRPAPSQRTNVVKRLAKANKLPTLEELTALTHQMFSSRRPLAQYAQARTLFLYLDDKNLLGEWMQTYVHDPEHGFAQDESGLTALDVVTEIPRERAQRTYKTWVARELPEAAERFTDLRVSLGVGLEPGEGDGPRITKIPGRIRREAGLRRGDYITSIDGRPVTQTNELVRILDGYNVGQVVTLTFRRGKLHGETTLTLSRSR
ncbi:MAG: PDZ domain-containing protein [Planctomycetota bacterium]